MLALLVSVPGRAGAASPQGPTASSKFDRALRAASEGKGNAPSRVRVIVRVARANRAAVKRSLTAQGHIIRYEHTLISALTVEVPTAALAGISRMPGVIAISLDAPVSPTATPSTGSALRQATGFTERVDAYDGSGVGVAVVDSGIAPSADFGDRITAFYDFTIGGAATAASDPYGHGTHVAGLVGGSGAMSEGMYRGMASGVSLIGLRVLDAQGSGQTSDVIAALEFATINKNALGIDVMNMSLGHPPLESAATDPLVAAVEQASAAGIIVVVSAGNIGLNPQTGLPGYGGITSPGDAPSAITVGAVDTAGTGDRSDDSIGPFSSRGPSWYDNAAKPDIVAAGMNLVAPVAADATLAVHYPTRDIVTSGGNYMRLTGTSMAAAVVSGTVAVLLEMNRTFFPQHPALTPNTMKAMLEFTATRMFDPVTLAPYDRMTQGAGALNADGAGYLATYIDTTAPVGSMWITADLTPYSETWGKSVTWGSTEMWGDAIYINLAG